MTQHMHAARMGAQTSKPKKRHDHNLRVGAPRNQAITGGGGGKNIAQRTRPDGARAVDESDCDFVVHALSKLLLFSKTDSSLVRKVAMGMWERDCDAGVYLVSGMADCPL